MSVDGQGSMYFYNILNDINKLKVLLVFLSKGFTWQRELKSLGIFGKDIELILTEFDHLGLIELKELWELDDIQYETFLICKNDMESYYKIYFTKDRLFELLNKHKVDFEAFIKNNSYLLDFNLRVKDRLKPFMIKLNQIEREENTLYSRKVTLNGVTFEKDTELKRILAKEIKLLLPKSKHQSALVLHENKPLALLSPQERKKILNKVTLNGQEVKGSIFRELDEKDKESQKLFDSNLCKTESGRIIDAHVGLSESQVETEVRKRQAGIFDLLGIEEEKSSNRGRAK